MSNIDFLKVILIKNLVLSMSNCADCDKDTEATTIGKNITKFGKEAFASKEKAEKDAEDMEINGPEHSFMCGVVEGFYGRPWTAEQRKELFRRYIALMLTKI